MRYRKARRVPFVPSVVLKRSKWFFDNRSGIIIVMTRGLYKPQTEILVYGPVWDAFRLLYKSFSSNKYQFLSRLFNMHLPAEVRYDDRNIKFYSIVTGKFDGHILNANYNPCKISRAVLAPIFGNGQVVTACRIAGKWLTLLFSYTVIANETYFILQLNNPQTVVTLRRLMFAAQGELISLDIRRKKLIVHKRSPRNSVVHQCDLKQFTNGGSIDDFSWSPDRFLLFIVLTKQGFDIVLLKLNCIPVAPIIDGRNNTLRQKVIIHYSALDYKKGYFHVGPNHTLFNIITIRLKRGRDVAWKGVDLYVAER
jgi:hypothetical protein